MINRFVFAGVSSACALFSTLALAHHEVASAPSSRVAQALLSDVGHALISLDHPALHMVIGLCCTLIACRLVLMLRRGRR